MALMAIISGVTNTTPGTASEHTHGLAAVPDIVIPTLRSGNTCSGQIFLAVADTASSFQVVGTMASMAFRALVIKFHTLVR